MTDIQAEPGDLYLGNDDRQLWIVEDICGWPVIAVKNIETEFVFSGKVNTPDLIAFTPLKNIRRETMAQIIIRLSEAMPRLRRQLTDTRCVLRTVRKRLADTGTGLMKNYQSKKTC